MTLKIAQVIENHDKEYMSSYELQWKVWLYLAPFTRLACTRMTLNSVVNVMKTYM